MKKIIIILLTLFFTMQLFANQKDIRIQKGLTLSAAKKAEVLKKPGIPIELKSGFWTTTYAVFLKDKNLIKKVTIDSCAKYLVVCLIFIFLALFSKKQTDLSYLLKAKEILRS